jgi:polar amino acid transport system substrate-binding protein
MLSATAGIAAADVLDEIKTRGDIKCGVVATTEPFGFQDPKSRELVGYEIDLCRDLAKALGVKSELKVVSSQGRIPELLQGRIDVLVALITYSPERAEQVDFSNAYVGDTFKFVVAKDSDLQSLADLKTKRISVIKGSILEPIVQRRFPEAKILSFEDAPAAYVALQQGKVAATIQRTTQVRALQVRSGDTGDTRLLAEPLLTQKSGFAIRKGNPQFLAALNRFLDEYEASGEAQKLYGRWMGNASAFKLPREFKVGDKMTD